MRPSLPSRTYDLAVLDVSRDSREGISLHLGLIVYWLLALAPKPKPCIVTTTGKDFGIVSGCTIVCTLINVT